MTSRHSFLGRTSISAAGALPALTLMAALALTVPSVAAARTR